MVSGTLEKCSLHGWIPVHTVPVKLVQCVIMIMTLVHFIDGNLNEVPCRSIHLLPSPHTAAEKRRKCRAQHNSWKLKTSFCKAWYSPNMSPADVWDALDQSAAIPANIQQLHTGIKEEWTTVTQATINLINSMWRFVTLHEVNGDHTR